MEYPPPSPGIFRGKFAFMMQVIIAVITTVKDSHSIKKIFVFEGRIATNRITCL